MQVSRSRQGHPWRAPAGGGGQHDARAVEELTIGDIVRTVVLLFYCKQRGILGCRQGVPKEVPMISE